MIHKNFRKTLLRVEFLLGFLILAFLVFSPVSTQAVSDVQFSIPFSKINPYISKLNDIKDEVVASTRLAAAQTASVLDALRNVFKAYITTAPIPPPVAEPVSPPPVSTVASPAPVITNQALLNALRVLFNDKNLASEFRGLTGPQGKEGPQGPQGSVGPPGINGTSGGTPSVIYSAPPAPAVNFSGASYFSATNITSGLISADTLKVTELKVSGSSTFTGGLNVTGASTFGALTVTSCTGCSPTTSLALSTAITDETGSGSLVFANTPTLVTPILGVATITSIAIGANTLDTTEWAFLDSINQTLATTSSPSFSHLNLPLQGELRLKDADSSNYVVFKSPSVVGSNQIWTLPSTDSSGCFQSNGVGLITIAACSGAAAAGAGITNDFRGLQLRTSPDADLAATTVTMIHVDELVTRDGVRHTPANNLSATITTSGINGLKAGQTETASTWYKVMFAYGGSGSGLYLEQGKDYFLDESAAATSTGNEPLRSVAAKTKLAQTFFTDESGKFEFVDL